MVRSRAEELSHIGACLDLSRSGAMSLVMPRMSVIRRRRALAWVSRHVCRIDDNCLTRGLRLKNAVEDLPQMGERLMRHLRGLAER